ncbi:hypothetical protein GGH95_004186 [Coemansia sp. RSA 1836]|nr:hypothetical protein GGH95_004186 [Coemansia sp. RSA 1836]
MLPAYIIENYAPRGERFRCWSIEYRCDLPVDEPVRCVLLLALACPNFDYAAVWSPSREKFMAHMKEVITTGGGFRPHKARLRRLLFGGWENEIPNTKVAPELAQMGEELMEETH